MNQKLAPLVLLVEVLSEFRDAVKHLETSDKLLILAATEVERGEVEG